MTNEFAKFAVISLLLPGLFACDEAELVDLDAERSLEPYTIATSKDGLDSQPLEPAPLEEGLAELEPLPEPFDPDEPPTCGPSETPMPGDLCPAWRQVGIFDGEECPSPYDGDPPDPHWTVEPMFAGLDNPVPGLEGFCRYVWTGDPNAIDPLPRSIEDHVGPDCRVFPQSPIASDLAPAYARAFREGTAPLPGNVVGGGEIKVAVIDTSPSLTSKGQAGHGQAMAAIVGELAEGCVPGLGESGNGCRRKVETYLGLPQTVDGPNYDQGGFYGYQSELAEAIAVALDDWPDANAGDQKLIMNLSVGWEPVADEFSDPEPAVQAIRDALAVGHCRGALIVAASGNRPPGTCFGDATGPGGWEREPGYSVAQCQGLGLALPDIELGDPIAAYHPFLYAATPLGWRRGNLPDLRVGSNARLTATGFAGFDEVNSRNYGPLTGSSVSTAVISGVAALAWSSFDDLSADEVMALLYDAGAPTSNDVTLELGNSSPEQRQVTACGAMNYACDHSRIGDYLRPGQSAPNACDPAHLASCDPTSPPQVDAAAWSSAFTLAFGQLGNEQSSSVIASSSQMLECNQCGAVEITHIPDTMDTEPEHMGWVVPEPHKPPCPHCRIKGPDLYLTLDPTYDSYDLQALTVNMYDATGAPEVLHYDPATLTLDSTSVEVVFDADLQTVSGNLPPVSATVTMTFTDPNNIATTRPITASNTLAID